MHKFEAAGLGDPPYKFECITETTEGVPHKYERITDTADDAHRCDYCRQPIRYAYWFRAAYSRYFKVGGDCFWKAHEGEDTRPGTPGRELVKTVKKARHAFMKKIRDERLVRETKDIRQRMANDTDYLADKPHPRPYSAAQGKTLRDHVVGTLDWGSIEARVKVCKIVASLA